MTIKQIGGIFGRNPSFNEIDAVDGNFSGNLTVDTSTLFVDASNNRVGVGTTSPAEPLHVIGTVRSTTSSTGDNNFYATSTGGGAYRIYPDSAATANPTWLHQSNSSEDIAWVIGGVERMRLNSSGSLSFPSGNGIDFSATSGTGTSELFDDYEEGTWTPVPADAASGGNTGTAASVEGIYTKIGNTVFVQFGLLNINTTGLTAGNDFYIQGLPYSAGNTALTSYATGACIPSGSISYTGEVVAGVTDNTSAVRLVETSSGGNLDYVIVSQLTSGGSDIWASLVYRTA